MRRQQRDRWWLVGVFGAAAMFVGCKSEEKLPNVGAIADANYGDAPSRGVADALPDGLNIQGDGPDTNLSGGIGSMPVGGTDAIDDRPGTRADTGSGPPDAGAGGCSLLRQDCTGARGCYPAAATGSAGTCKPAGGFVENQPCEQHDDCAPGLICAEVLAGAGRLCEPICDSTAVRPCPDNRQCRPFGGSLIGACEP